MVVTLFCETLEALQSLSAEIVNAAATEGVKMIGERVAAKAHYLSQHPGNQPSARQRRHQSQLRGFRGLPPAQFGKPAALTPWGRVITYLPTPEQSAYRFSYHEQGSPDKEPTSGHTLIMGRPGRANRCCPPS